MKPSWKLALAVSGLVTILHAKPVPGQERPASPQRPASSASDTSDTGLAPSASSNATLMDRPFERNEYILGPGDGVDVSIFGEVNRFHRLTVTPEGTLLIPAVGVANVRGLNLDEAQRRVSAAVGRQYRNVEVDVSLSRLRTFKVFLLGSVTNPGVRVASAATRVSEIVPMAQDTVIRRTITVKHADGAVEQVDLLRFVALGDLDANPRLREGEAIFVPPIDRVITAYGGFANTGTFEYRAGEKLADFIRILNGGAAFPANAADTIRISRISANRTREVHTFTRDQALTGAGQTFELRPFDALYLPTLSDFALQPSASVRGQVRRPGTYPIKPDTTTVEELVAMAGGFTAEAAPAEATLTRTPRAASPRRFDLEAVPTEALSPDEIRILQARGTGNPNAVVLDFSQALAGGTNAFRQKLANGDMLDVPRIRREVTVLGAVAQPGIVTFEPGRKAEYFVRLAGGYTKQADRGESVVLRSRTGARFDADDAGVLEPGDQVVVPFRENVSFTERLMRTQTLVMTLSSLVFTYLGVKQILN